LISAVGTDVERHLFLSLCRPRKEYARSEAPARKGPHIMRMAMDLGESLWPLLVIVSRTRRTTMSLRHSDHRLSRAARQRRRHHPSWRSSSTVRSERSLAIRRTGTSFIASAPRPPASATASTARVSSSKPLTEYQRFINRCRSSPSARAVCPLRLFLSQSPAGRPRVASSASVSSRVHGPA
jgi:hypothetical protein